MKKYFKYILAIAAVAFSMTACKDEDGVLPGEADNSGCYGVYFPSQEASGSHTYDPTMDPSADIIVKRTNSKGAITVPVNIIDENGVYTVAPITFADGQSETTVRINFPNAEMGKEYPLYLTITDPAYASKYQDNPTSFDFSVMRVEWKKFYGEKATEETSKGHITEVCWEEEYDVDMYYYETAYENIRYCYLEGAWQGNTSTEDYIFYWNTKNNNLYVPQQSMGYTVKNGDVYAGAACDFYNSYYGWGEVCPSEEYFSWATSWIAKNGFFQPYYDGNGGFYLADWTYLCKNGVATGSGYQFGGTELDADLFVAAGFVRTDFHLDSEVDFTQEGYLPVYYNVGADVASIKLAGFEGELSKAATEKKIAEMTADPKDLKTLSTEDFEQDGKDYLGATGLQFEKSGIYTVISLGYDKDGNLVATSSCFGPYMTVDDEEKNPVQITVGTEDISKRYESEGYDATNSFGFYIQGKDIKEAKYAAVKTTTYEQAPETFNALVKAGIIEGEDDEDDGIEVLTSEECDSLSAFGGYANIITGLNALTSYTLIVYANNGTIETFKTAEYTTEGLPNEVIKEGTLAYYYSVFFTDDDENPVWDDEYNLEYNPNTEMYEIPDWGYGVTFAFSYDEKTGTIKVPKQFTGFSYPGYGDFYVMDADALPQSWIDYFEIDTTKKSYYKDGIFYIHVAYVSSLGAFGGAGYEIIAPDGIPAAASAPAANRPANTMTTALSKNVNDFVKIRRIPYVHEAKEVSFTMTEIQYKKTETAKSIRSFKPAQLEK